MHFLLSLFLLSTVYAADLPYDDQEFGCIGQAAADRYVRAFGVDVKSFGGLELCDGSRDTKKLLNDLYLIEGSTFEAAGEHKFIRGYVDRQNYFEWLKQETRGVRRGHDLPYATAYNSGGYFTMQDGWAKLSTLGRVGTIIHEARHTAGYRHYACTFGPYANSRTAGCDTSYEQGGSHAVEMEYYARVVLESKNLHPVYQSMARLMALGRSNFVFNKNPLQKREALLGLSAAGLVLVDGGQVYERALPAVPAEARLKRTSFGASLVAGEQSLAIDLSDPTEFSLTDDYSYYKLFQLPRDRAPTSVKSTEEVDIGNMRYFTVLSNEGRISSYNFPEGNWFAASNPVADAATFVTRAPDGQAGLFVVTTDGSILPFDPSTRRYGLPLKDRWPSDSAAYAMLGAQLVVLNAEGEVLDAESGVGVPSLAHYRFTELVNVPLYDAFEVVP